MFVLPCCICICLTLNCEFSTWFIRRGLATAAARENEASDGEVSQCLVSRSAGRPDVLRKKIAQQTPNVA
jgi:hypothetical protein